MARRDGGGGSGVAAVATLVLSGEAGRRVGIVDAWGSVG